MVSKICPNMKLSPLLHHFPSTTKHLGKMRLHIYNIIKFFKKLKVYNFAKLTIDVYSIYDNQIVHHNHCFNLLIRYNNLFDNQ